ncbi:protein CREG1-like [Anopheles cruzii]|uniref:protein CREG1-like n=1 Tax=Anopheles cruzii TaxID=68878 RepID=UPI0022EC80D0|nr:protein CREG1-like [Anopheles cruzii]
MTAQTTVTYQKFGEPATNDSPPQRQPSCAVLVVVVLLALTMLSFTLFLTLGPILGLYSAPYFTAFDKDDPPPHTEYARMARYLVHKAEWVSMGTLSTVEEIKGYPMVNIISVADSERGQKSTGVMYFYLTMLDYTAQDLDKDNRLTVMISMDEDLACTKQGVDPMEPTCGRLMISGKVVKIDPSSDEFKFGKAAMYSRHPAAKIWTNTHNFFLCKMDIVQIAVLDYYGGPHYVTVEDYMAADPDKKTDVANKRRIPARFTSEELDY